MQQDILSICRKGRLWCLSGILYEHMFFILKIKPVFKGSKEITAANMIILGVFQQ